MHLSGCFIWWAQTDLNCRPTDYESAALTNWAIGPYMPNLLYINKFKRSHTNQDFFKKQVILFYLRSNRAIVQGCKIHLCIL